MMNCCEQLVATLKEGSARCSCGRTWVARPFKFDLYIGDLFGLKAVAGRIKELGK